MSNTLKTDTLHEELCEDEWPTMYGRMRTHAEQLEQKLNKERSFSESVEKLLYDSSKKCDAYYVALHEILYAHINRCADTPPYVVLDEIAEIVHAALPHDDDEKEI